MSSSSSPIQDLLDRIDRLHLMLTSELPILSPTIPTTRMTINTMKTCQLTVESESVIIDELQQYIKKLEREREILLRSYSIILQLLKHHDLDERSNVIEQDYSELFHSD